MNHIDHSLCNDTLGAGDNENTDDLRIMRGTIDELPVVQSFWMPTSDELRAIKAGHPIILTVVGRTHAPLLIQVSDKPLYRIIEEVPGVPKEEQYFISGPECTYQVGHPHFPNSAKAKEYCVEKGWNYIVVPFEP